MLRHGRMIANDCRVLQDGSGYAIRAQKRRIALGNSRNRVFCAAFLRPIFF
jgi:hypothetical protein